MIHIDAERCRQALPFDQLIPALAAGFANGCRMPPRHVYTIDSVGRPLASAGASAAASAATCGGDPALGMSLIMPAWGDGENALLGIKIANIFPGNGTRGLPSVHATYTLFDAATGVPLATLDGDVITLRRTAATAALAASRLLPPQLLSTRHPIDLCVVGAGRIARLLPAAFGAVLRLGQVRVWNRRPEAAHALVEIWSNDALEATSLRAVADLEPAVSASMLVSCATLATEPVVHGEWLAENCHLDLIGSFTPAMREVTPSAFANAEVWLDTGEAATKSGDVLDAIAAGTLTPSAIAGDLAALIKRSDPKRSDPSSNPRSCPSSNPRSCPSADPRSEPNSDLGPRPRASGAGNRRTVFKAVGSALADLYTAALVWKSVSP